MKRCFWKLSCVCIVLAMPLAASTIRIYVLNEGSSDISVIDPQTNKVVQTIKGIVMHHGAVFSPDGRRAYITAETDHSLNVLDIETGKFIKKVQLSGIANLPALAKDGKRVFVCINNWREGPTGVADPDGIAALDIVDITSLQKTKTLPMKGNMHDCYITPDGRYAVGGSSHGNFIAVYDVNTEQLAWTLDVDRGVLPIAIEANPDGSSRRIFMQLRDWPGFGVVDFATRKEVARIRFPEPPNGFMPLDGEPAHGMGIAPGGHTLWVCSAANNAVLVYSLPDLKLQGQITMPEIRKPGHPVRSGDPHWMTFTPDGKTAYVSLTPLNMVSAIDVKSMKEVARIPVGSEPKRLHALLIP